MLLTNSIEKNPADDQGDTPLHYAAINGNLEMCNLIISNTQDKNPANDRGKTPLDHAKSFGYSEISKLIFGNFHEKINKDLELLQMSG